MVTNKTTWESLAPSPGYAGYFPMYGEELLIPRLRRVLPHEWGRVAHPPAAPGTSPRMGRVCSLVADRAPDHEPAVVIKDAATAGGQRFEVYASRGRAGWAAQERVAVDHDIVLVGESVREIVDRVPARPPYGQTI